MVPNPFLADAQKQMKERGHHIEGQLVQPPNPFLVEQERKEKTFQQGQQKTPWMQQPGMFGVNRQNALMGGLGLLTGGRMF